MSDRTCYAADRCIEYDHRTRSGAPLAPDAAPLCPDCLRVTERDIRSLPGDYVDLEQLLPPSLAAWSDGQPRRGRDEHPLPLREHVLVLQRHIWWVLTAWEPVVRELDRLSDQPTHVREGWAVQRASTIIAPRVAALATVGPTTMADYPPVDGTLSAAIVWGPDRRTAIAVTTPTGADGLLHLRRLHTLARTMTGLTKRIRRLPGSCHECMAEGTLRQHEPRRRGDDPPVWCDDHPTVGGCGAWRPFDEYERLVKLIVWQGH